MQNTTKYNMELKKKKQFIIPKEIADIINSYPFTNIQKFKATKMVSILYYFKLKLVNEGGWFNHSYNQFVAEYGTHYKPILDALMKSGIILRNGYYSKDKGVAYAYSIADEYMQDDYVISEFKNYDKELSGTRYFNGLVIDYEKTTKVCTDYITEMDLKSIQIIDTLDENESEVIEISEALKSPYFTNLNDKIKQLSNTDKRIIRTNKRNIIANPEEHLFLKKQHTANSYLYTFGKLQTSEFDISINKTNGRLDSIFTNMPSIMLDVIKSTNNLTEIDIRNCQFAIFAKMLKADPDFNQFEDVKNFVEIAEKGILYEELMKIFGKERKEVKAIMMQIAFSSPVMNNKKRLFDSMFPNVYRYASEYKKDNGNNQFAIRLQREESNIFIQGLLPILNEKAIFVITKHDSLIVKKADKEKVQEIMQDYFKTIDFEATF